MKTRFFCFPDMQTAFALAQEAGLTTTVQHRTFVPTGENSTAYVYSYLADGVRAEWVSDTLLTEVDAVQAACEQWSDDPGDFAEVSEVRYERTEETPVMAEVISEEQVLKAYTNDYALDVIGVLHMPTGNMIEGGEGTFYPETAPAPGWHVNARILSGDPLPESFAQYEVFPVTPSRNFA